MPKPKNAPAGSTVEPSGLTAPLRRALETYAGDNEAAPRDGIERRTEPGDPPQPAKE